MKKHLSAAALLFMLILSALFGCFDADASSGILTVSASGTLVIRTAELTTTARFYDYRTDGTTVQIIALLDGNGAVHAAFNTCQSCSPSPKAFYVQVGDELICKNCEFAFIASEVGAAQGGCNPWPIPGIEITEEEIRIPAESAEAMRSVFAAEGR